MAACAVRFEPGPGLRLARGRLGPRRRMWTGILLLSVPRAWHEGDRHRRLGDGDPYGRFGITFTVADIHTAVFPERFDCLFVRSCSLYNTAGFAADDEPTRELLRHVKPNGTFIFAYNSNFSSRPSPTWRYHSLADVRAHFRRYPAARIFFSTRIGTWLLRRYALGPLATRLNVLVSGVSGMGGDLVCILGNPARERS